MKKNESRGEKHQPFESMATLHRWKYSALAAATLASLALHASNALALSLGPVTVQSALGEPLRAEIELPGITAAETESLKVGTAPAETFRSQGMEYSGAVSQIQVALQNRPGGRAVLRLSSSRPVNEPFVDLVIDAVWATGRITRSYTMLFDPPASRRPAPAVTVVPQLSAPSAAATLAAARASAVPAPRPVTPSAAVRLLPPAAPSAGAGSVTVKAGDTAGRIGNANRPQGVSLDQMLVAMLRTNPQAFIGGNVNRVKAGAVLDMPNAEQARATPAAEARQTIAAQSRDFNSFRRNLAASAPAAEAPSAEAGRSASGKVQTQVQEDTVAAASPDKLTLSKGVVKGTQATPEALAKRKQTNQAAARVDELAKNIDELNKLSGSSATGTAAPAASTTTAADTSVATSGTPATTAAPAPAAPAAGIAVPGPGLSATPAVPDAALATAGSAPGASSVVGTAAPGPSTSDAATTASTPVPAISGDASPAVGDVPAVTPASPPAVAPAVAAQEPSLLDTVLGEPLIPAAVALLLLLLGYAGYRASRSRRNTGGVDSSFLESRLQPDSFFGASGGQRVDTGSTETTTGSSMAFSPSQLDAGGDVDPVAEADVYLAYGRDLQAEEILKEAVRHNPERLSVYAKLADIYAKRQDRKALEAQAQEIFRITHGEGAEWNRVCELGQDIDPENRYYQPGGQLLLTPDFAPPSSFASTYGGAEGPSSLPADLDLDLDLDLPDDALTEPSSEPPNSSRTGGFAAAALEAASVEAAGPPKAPEDNAPEVSAWVPPGDKQEPAWSPPSAATPGHGHETIDGVASTSLDADALDFPMDLPPLDTEPQGLALGGGGEAFTPSNSGLMDFDMSSVSLDLGPATSPAPFSPEQGAPPVLPMPDDPLATKLALAHEFNTIGDNDGARTLIEEVIAEASGELKARAQRMLKELN